MANATLLFLFLSLTLVSYARSEQVIPALYVFGDSTVDPGNVFNTPRALGKSIVDFIAPLLGLPPVTPFYIYNMTKDENDDMKTGINYGFSGVGILPQTGSKGIAKMNYWSFHDQIQLFFNSTLSIYFPRVFQSDDDIVQHLAKSVFMISFGINDYHEIYLPPANGQLSHLEPDAFAQHLLRELTSHLTALHKLGARKFLINNIWPLGCAPLYENMSNPLEDHCNKTINDLVLPYSTNLPLKLKELQCDLANVVLSYSNNFCFVKDLKTNGARYGITNIKNGCCITEGNCTDCEHSLYRDVVHTTETANQVFAVNCFNGTLCSPLNIMGLVRA